MELSLVPSVQFFLHLSNLRGKMGLIKHTSHLLLFTVEAHCTGLQSEMTVWINSVVIKVFVILYHTARICAHCVCHVVHVAFNEPHWCVLCWKQWEELPHTEILINKVSVCLTLCRDMGSITKLPHADGSCLNHIIIQSEDSKHTNPKIA